MRSTPMPKLTRRTVKDAEACVPAAADHHAFERLDALFVALGFLQADVDLDRVAGMKFRNVFAQCIPIELINNQIHG